MKEINIKLTQKQLDHLVMFLDRADLKGSEVMKFVELARAINESLKNPNKNIGQQS